MVSGDAQTAERRAGGGRFLVIDGVDGCGKSTQARLLAERLSASGEAPLHLREPGSTPLGEELREIFLSRRHRLSPAVEALLVTAARRQMLDEVVAPALAAGRDVVCERFHSSTVAYQGHAGGLGIERVEALLGAWADEPRPERTFVLDVDVGEASRRRGGDSDRVEDRGVAFQREVAEGFRRFARAREDVSLIDGGRSVDDVAAEIWTEVSRGDR